MVGVRRFCTPVGLPVHLGEDGFLADPETNIGRAAAPQLTSFEQVATGSVVVLLGEPGAGKTSALHQATDQRDPLVVDLELVADADEFKVSVLDPLIADEVLWQSGPVTSAEDKPVDAILAPLGAPPPAHVLDDDGVPEPEPAVDLVGRAVVVLDNVERCPMAPKRLAASLMDLLGRVKPGRLSLLLACRTSEWPTELEARLRAQVPDVCVVELAPLRHADVRSIAAERGGDPDGFLTAVVAAGATALAIVPITLELLIEIYGRDRQLPASSADLYEQGLLCLADEPDRARREERRRDRRDPLSPQRRIAVATRIAAWSQLCGYAGVFRDQPAARHMLREGDLVGGVEPMAAGDIRVDSLAVADALDSPLFTGGIDRVALRHHTVAAYLAALYLVRHGVAEQQLHSLLIAPIGDTAAIYPSLRETAAWLVVLAPNQHRWLIEVDAETIGSYPYAIDSPDVRRALVDHLLDLAGRDALRSRPGSIRQYARLAHPGLIQQLRPVLAGGSPLQKEITFQLAAAAEAADLVDDLLRLASDNTASDHVRARAASTASALNRAAAAPRLRDLLTSPADPQGEDMLGALLSATWPEVLTVEELLGALRPDTPNRVTGYTLFLWQLPDLLRDHDLPAVLDWAATIPASHPPATAPMRPDNLVHALITRAWRAGNRDALVASLATVLHRCLRDDLPVEVPTLSSTPGSADEIARRHLIEHLVDLAESTDDIARLAYSPMARSLGLLRLEDLAWLLAHESDTAQADGGLWRVLIRAVFSPMDPQHQLLAWQWEGTSIWDEVFAGWLAAIPLDSDRARELRTEHDRKAQRAAERAAERAAHRQNTVTGLRQLLDHAERGEPDAFWRLCWSMQLDPDTEAGITMWGDDLTERPGYAALPPADQARVLPAAELYLDIQHPNTDEWIDSANTVDYRAQAGYLAFALLHRHAPNRLAALPARTWRTWAAALLWFDASSANAGNPDCKKRLLGLLAERAADAVIDPAVRLLRARSAAGSAARELTFLATCWTESLSSALTTELPGLFTGGDGENFDTVLHLLLTQNHGDAERYARDLIAPGCDLSNPLTRHAARVLIVTGPERAWPLVFTSMQATPQWGRELIMDLSRDWIHPKLPVSLDEPDLARLYAWLLTQFPPNNSPVPVGFHGIGREEQARYWQERVLYQLAERGTEQAVHELQALAREYPQYGGLRRAHLHALESHRHDHWAPTTLPVLRALLADSDRRYVRNDLQLRNLVLTALADIQRTMQAETPQAIFLWNEYPNGTTPAWRPKSENDISDYVAGQLRLRLRDSGVVVNREIEIARTSSQGIGDRVDLLVTATAPHNPAVTRPDFCTVVIEVKGCWNRGLLTSMEKQLALDYLPTVGTNYGIYLIGWFPLDQWDNTDARTKSVPRGDQSSLFDELRQQARLLGEQLSVDIVPFVLDAERRRKASRR